MDSRTSLHSPINNHVCIWATDVSEVPGPRVDDQTSSWTGWLKLCNVSDDPTHTWFGITLSYRTDTFTGEGRKKPWLMSPPRPPAAANIGGSSYGLFWIFGTQKKKFHFRCWANERVSFTRSMIQPTALYSPSCFGSKSNCKLLSYLERGNCVGQAFWFLIQGNFPFPKLSPKSPNLKKLYCQKRLRKHKWFSLKTPLSIRKQTIWSG